MGGGMSGLLFLERLLAQERGEAFSVSLLPRLPALFEQGGVAPGLETTEAEERAETHRPPTSPTDPPSERPPMPSPPEPWPTPHPRPLAAEPDARPERRPAARVDAAPRSTLSPRPAAPVFAPPMPTLAAPTPAAPQPATSLRLERLARVADVAAERAEPTLPLPAPRPNPPSGREDRAGDDDVSPREPAPSPASAALEQRAALAAAPRIEIHIGRIEVRAPQAPPSPARPRAAEPARSGLDAFLARRRER
jgi:hypothetical protein